MIGLLNEKVRTVLPNAAIRAKSGLMRTNMKKTKKPTATGKLPIAITAHPKYRHALHISEKYTQLENSKRLLV